MMKESVFTQITISNGDVLDILELKVGHILTAMILAGSTTDQAKILIQVILQCVKKDGKSITQEYLENIGVFEFTKICEAINVQSTEINIK